MSYLLDANVFIEAKNLYYGFDICPAFWNWIDDAYHQGIVLSIEKVGDELLQIDDELAAWARLCEDGFFVKPDSQVLPSLRSTSTWANGAGYDPAAVNIFLQGADYYLVAQAHAHGHVVVTHEKPSTSTKKLKIPDACIGLGIKCVNTFQMLRSERARFVLGGTV
jgi:hypothetical protein